LEQWDRVEKPAAIARHPSAVPKEKGGMAAGLTSTLRYVGGMAGLSTLGLLLSDTPARAVAQQEHVHAVTVFCVALAMAALCALSLPGRATSTLADER
jgi:sugar phosphate permease